MLRCIRVVFLDLIVNNKLSQVMRIDVHNKSYLTTPYTNGKIVQRSGNASKIAISYVVNKGLKATFMINKLY